MDSKAAIDAFIKEVSTLNESDYGDFKRKAGMYLSRLEGHLQNAPTAVRKDLWNMKSFLLFTPDLNVRATQHRTIESAQHLKKHLQ